MAFCTLYTILAVTKSKEWVSDLLLCSPLVRSTSCIDFTSKVRPYSGTEPLTSGILYNLQVNSGRNEPNHSIAMWNRIAIVEENWHYIFGIRGVENERNNFYFDLTSYLQVTTSHDHSYCTFYTAFDMQLIFFPQGFDILLQVVPIPNNVSLLLPLFKSFLMLNSYYCYQGSNNFHILYAASITVWLMEVQASCFSAGIICLFEFKLLAKLSQEFI